MSAGRSFSNNKYYLKVSTGNITHINIQTACNILKKVSFAPCTRLPERAMEGQ